MTQQEIFNILKKNKNWMTTKEVAELSDSNLHSTLLSLNKLYWYKEVSRKRVMMGKHWTYIWKAVP